jgi:glycosyltransferase involved in cell wall biosynthesis
MRVAFDTNALYTTQAGVARYIRGLLKGFKQVAAPDVQIRQLAWEKENFQYRQPQRALKTFYRECVWAKFSAPCRLREMKADLLHATSLPLVNPQGIYEVITLHDLAVLRYPERFRPWQRAFARRNLHNVSRAQRIICVSRFTADEAMTLLHLPAAKLAVIHHGCDFHRDEPPVNETKPAFPIPSEYFLFVGSLEPGKNLAFLKEVYGLAESRGVALPPLLVVGARWAGVEHEGVPPKNWHYLGRQPDEVLIHLYRHALALVFPTKYEGFGFPLVEALALGCPVICSPVASLPEVGGDAAGFTSMSPPDYLAAMLRMNRDSAWRAELIAKGLVQAAAFSWKKCAGEVLGIYRSVLGTN